ncbi:MAG: hypothetical protein QOJ63_1974 [Solirubrobacteraceae bacterium]|nr:hypothetical protein [Solirubrobacteraceae bacterium]
MSVPPVVWTVGHSNRALDEFAESVLGEQIEFLVDVRSFPYSRFAPHFNREELDAAMSQLGVRYIFLGGALGGRPEREEHYDAQGHALYGPMSKEPEFVAAIGGLLEGAREHRLALLCSCGDPVNCHRRLLVGKVLCDQGVELRHILRDGCVQTERSVTLEEPNEPKALFGHDERPWRSAQSVSHRRRLSTSSSV